MAKHKQKMHAKNKYPERPSQPPITTANNLRSFSERLSALRDENDQVIRRARRTGEMCSALQRDIALALSRLEMETAEQQRAESRLQLERDELARELAELKHRERQRARKNGEQVQHTTMSPLTVVDSTEERPRRVIDDNSINVSDDIKNDFNGASIEAITTCESTAPIKSFESSCTVDTAERSSWTCPACTYENSSSVQTCDMCGAQASSPAEDSTTDMVSKLVEIGYVREDIFKAMDELDDAEKNEPAAIILWIDAKEEKAVEEGKRRKQKIMEKARLHKEHEANERAARKKADKEAQERARLEAQQAEERNAREAAERVRREARETKELARKVAADNAKREKEQKEQEETVNLYNKSLSSPVFSVFGGLPTLDDKSGMPGEDESTSSAAATVHSNKASSSTSKLVKLFPSPQLVSLRSTSSTAATPIEFDKLSQH